LGGNVLDGLRINGSGGNAALKILKAVDRVPFLLLREYSQVRANWSIALCLPPRRHLPPPHRDVAIDRVQFHRETAPPSALGCNNLGAGAAERFIDQIAGIGKRRQYRLD